MPPLLLGKSKKDIQDKKTQTRELSFSLFCQVASNVTCFCDSNLLFQATAHVCRLGGNQNLMLQRKFCSPR